MVNYLGSHKTKDLKTVRLGEYYLRQLSSQSYFSMGWSSLQLFCCLSSLFLNFNLE